MLSLMAVLAKKVIKMIISLMNHRFIILMIFTDLFSAAFRKIDITYDTDMILILHANYTMILQTLLFLHEMYTKAVKT